MIKGSSSTSHSLPLLHKQPQRQRQEKRLLLCGAVLVCFSWTVSVGLGGVAHSALFLPDPTAVFAVTTKQQKQQHLKSALIHHGKSNNTNGAMTKASGVMPQPTSMTATTRRKQEKGLPLVECALSTPRPSADAAANGVIAVTVRSDLSPIASNVFLQLVESHYYDGVFIFRVLPNFIAQWGVRSDPWPAAKPSKLADPIDNNKTLSNRRGTLSFAGGNPATRQVFVNLNDANVRLDRENSRPFATLDEASMVLLDKLYCGYEDGNGQIQTLNKGPEAMLENFPHMSRIDQCRVVVR